MLQGYRFETLTDFVGKPLGLTQWHDVTQEQIQQFADCTGDHQWIHVDAVRCASESPFGAPVAHGFPTLSLLAKLLMDLGVVPTGVSRAINAGVDGVRFKAPVRAGSRVRARATIESARTKGDARALLVTSAALEVEGEDDPALAAQITLMLFR
ncbi:MaoC family dehydratase [Sinimarinibacterium sp. CAU 1509]|uniref:MaoC family dehydratase n=1 Tax=Sinimarinibacterium sp. CAU 1509 TaxID=2562283 RepID=UPI0010ABDA02|nr:MaoC family dehydratase [Sinimarinibacterium sp. CAU 1509]TJY59820.1 MaoC family dehydratase [Sinimarinibacterium sp. CAU 1509]